MPLERQRDDSRSSWIPDPGSMLILSQQATDGTLSPCSWHGGNIRRRDE